MDVSCDGLVIPRMTAWYRQNSIISTPDNGLLYHMRVDVMYMPPFVQERMPTVRVFKLKTMVKAIACSPDWSSKREFATLDAENHLQVWDLQLEQPIRAHHGHAESYHPNSENYDPQTQTSAMCYTYNGKIISADHSTLIVFCLMTDKYTIHPALVRKGNTVVLLSACRTDKNLFAAGLRDGLIQVFSMKDMTVVHSLRGHDLEIVSMDWMQVTLPADDGAEPQNTSWRSQPKTPAERPRKQARKKKTEPDACEEASAGPADNSDIFDIYEYDENAVEFGTIVDRKSVDDKSERFRDKVKTTEGFDFLEACQNLKEDILKAATRRDDEEDDGDGDEKETSPFDTDDENELDEAGLLRDYRKDDSFVSDDEAYGERHPRKLVLMSSSRDNTIWLWDVVVGRPIEKIAVPQGIGKQQCPGNFINAVWIDQSRIAANTGGGQVIEWKLSFTVKDATVLLKATALDAYPVDKIIHICRSVGPFTGCDPDATYIWCISLNRKLIAVQVKKEATVVAEYGCLLKWNMVFAENPNDSFLIAIGCCDRKISTLNIADISYNKIVLRHFTNKICSKVTALDWHPEKDTYLAYGTAEGRIGIIDTDNMKNVPVLLKPFQSSTVYALKWCHMTTNGKNPELVLFASGKNKLVYYRTSGERKHEPIALQQFQQVSSVSASQTYLFVGSQSGILYVSDLKNDLQQLYCRTVSRKYICALQYNRGVLAVASNDSQILLINFANGFDDTTDANIGTLEGHTLGVCTVRWSRGASMRLVSSSFDGSIRVWDTVSRTCLAVHYTDDSSFCAAFSAIDENVVMYVGKNTTMSFFDYRKNPTNEKIVPKKPNPVMAKRDGYVAKKRTTRKAGTRSASKDSAVLDVSNDNELDGNNSMNGMPPSLVPLDEAEIERLTEQVKQITMKPMKHIPLSTNIPTAFQMAYREINRGKDVLDCIVKLLAAKEIDPEDVADENGSCEDGEDLNENNVSAVEKVNLVPVTSNDDEVMFCNEKFFSTEAHLKMLIEEEVRQHETSHTNSIALVLLPQLGMNLKQKIMTHVEKKTLTDQLVSLAPSISHQFWRQCCEAYAYQILEKQRTLAAIPYLLAANKINESIEALCEGKFYREAWVLCRLRKLRDHPINMKVGSEWAEHMASVGNFEGAAMIWTALKKYKNATEVLLRRKEMTDDIRHTIEQLNLKLAQQESS